MPFKKKWERVSFQYDSKRPFFEIKLHLSL